MDKIKVMIIDDSAFVRQTLAGILNQDPGIEVISTAADPVFAANKIPKERPDVITLDLEMPRMNGLTFLKKLMSAIPIPVIVISSLTEKGGEMTLKAFEYGAIEVITKPKLITKEFFEESRILLCDAVKAASQANMKRVGKAIKPILTNMSQPTVMPKLTADEILELSPQGVSIKHTTDKIIVLGASTGGTQAIESFLKSMPPDCPGIAIVQHMPEIFTKSFADRLNKICSISVTEAVNGEIIHSGKAIIAPGNKHMLIKKTGAKYSVEINDGPLVNRHRPSVDVLFRSAANCVGPNALGILMTGMGDDGAKGLLEMRNSGAHTIAEDESSCIVFGMPKAAINLNAAITILHLDEIPKFAIKHFKT